MSIQALLRRLRYFEWPDGWLWFWAALVVILANLAASAIFESIDLWLKQVPRTFSPVRFSYIFFFVILAWVLYLGRPGKIPPTRSRTLTDDRAEPRKHLILFLSNLEGTLKSLEPTLGVPANLFHTLSIHLPSNADLNHDLHFMVCHKLRTKKFWRWEMPLRAIREHFAAETLETVSVIASEQSLPQLHLFFELIRKYPQLRNIRLYSLVKFSGRIELLCPLCPLTPPFYEGWDFESFNDLSHGLGFLLEKFKEMKFQEDEIMIDFTGGQKVTSVVAAYISANSKVKAQYVQTNDPWQVKSYHMKYREPGVKLGL